LRKTIISLHIYSVIVQKNKAFVCVTNNKNAKLVEIYANLVG